MNSDMYLCLELRIFKPNDHGIYWFLPVCIYIAYLVLDECIFCTEQLAREYNVYNKSSLACNTEINLIYRDIIHVVYGDWCVCKFSKTFSRSLYSLSFSTV